MLYNFLFLLLYLLIPKSKKNIQINNSVELGDSKQIYITHIKKGFKVVAFVSDLLQSFFIPIISSIILIFTKNKYKRH